jgi:predicted anti-sigma-YlaC factor YlaD
VSNLHPPHVASSGSGPDRSADEITCMEFVELVTEYLEGVLDASALDLVEEHLVMCDWCVTYLDQMQSTVDGLRALRQPKPPGPPSTRLLAAVRARAGGDG